MKLSQSVLYLYCVLFAVQATADERVEFNRDIRPILSENCFYCHGFDEENREADLRLDTFVGASKSGVLSPGESESSELLRRILSDDPDDVMPPGDSEKHVTAEQAELIRRWIDQGAEYQEHWAWQPLTRPRPVGDVVGAAAIDAFLAARWDENQLHPADTAAPRQRLRRLSFDLRGLPPSAADVFQFEEAPTDEAFFGFRDRWMAELAYAEHQAVRWLDLVRWADTSGLVSDEPIASGAYRAWIIKALHDNMPFDQFSVAQLAGDLIPNANDDQLIASGYNRIVNTNCEAGAIEAEQLYKLKGEHVRAVGTVWLGLTTGCAECHDHKFDPISAKDYYRLAAFFDDLVEAGVYTPGDRREPLHYVHKERKVSQQDRRLVVKIADLQRQISNSPGDDQKTWLDKITQKLGDSKSRSDFLWIPGQLPAARIVEGEFAVTQAGQKVVRETKAGHGKFSRHHAAELMTGYVNQGSQKTDAAKDAWFADAWLDIDHRPEMIGLQISHGDYGRLGWKTANYETYYWGDDTSGTLRQSHSWSQPERVKRLGDLPTESGWVRLRIPFDQLVKPVGGQSFEAVGMAWLHTGGRVQWSSSGMEIRTDKVMALELGETGIRKWWEQPKNRQVYQQRAEFVAKAIKTDAAKRDPLQKEIVLDAFREHSHLKQLAELRTLESRLGILRSQAMPVLVSRQATERKTTRLLNRGDYQDTTGPMVRAAVPEFLGNPLPKSANRLDLANWLFAKENPLTARVFVNRLWHQFYGRGLSETLDDSGTQGDWPSNVALLDWLACEFRESDWDRDHMVRLLTSTKAYQLSSQPTADLLARDPNNRRHARQSRFRLTAESIRDSSLLAAGLLNLMDDVPTTSFFPYQPNAYWSVSDKIMFGSRHMDWNTSRERSQYNRSLYTFWKRQNIHPTMLAFDAPTRQECTAKRNITNTPGQALALLNDPIFVEAARVMATRVCQSGDGDNQRLKQAFRIAFQRTPTPSEADTLLELLQKTRSRFAAAPKDAQALLNIGQTSPPAAEDLTDIASWTIVTRTILNLHEFLNRP